MANLDFLERDSKKPFTKKEALKLFRYIYRSKPNDSATEKVTKLQSVPSGTITQMPFAKMVLLQVNNTTLGINLSNDKERI